jgi:hypothetical protein
MISISSIGRASHALAAPYGWSVTGRVTDHGSSCSAALDTDGLAAEDGMRCMPPTLATVAILLTAALIEMAIDYLRDE